MTKELFDKFLQNECTDEERAQVTNYLSAHPEAAEQWMPEEEFEHAAGNAGSSLPEDVKQKIIHYVSRRTYLSARRRVAYRRWLVAASLVLLAGITWLLSEAPAPAPLVAHKTKKTQDTIWSTLAASDSSLVARLPDRSVIKLTAHTSARYNNFFAVNGKRDVYLEGEAYFEVTKDKTKPFTVYSGSIATTALGTSFTVRSADSQHIIYVALHTGKVVVHPADGRRETLTKEVVLQPGNELFYNKQTHVASLRTHAPNKVAARRQKQSVKHPVVRPQWYEFNDQPLANVLDQLSFYYGVNIEYNEKDIRHCYLSAQYSHRDSLNNILHDIAVLNQLKIDKQHTTYIIRKAVP